MNTKGKLLVAMNECRDGPLAALRGGGAYLRNSVYRKYVPPKQARKAQRHRIASKNGRGAYLWK